MKTKIDIQFSQVVIKNKYITMIIKQIVPYSTMKLYNLKNGEMFFIKEFSDLEAALKYAKKFIKEQTIEELESQNN